MKQPVGVAMQSLAVRYGATEVLRDITLTVQAGEFFALLGPSGSGKSTLLRAIAGFVRPYAGRILIGDEDIAQLPPWRRNLGMVFQSYALWPHMTVAQNVAFGLEERRLPRAEVRTRVGAALATVDLAGYAERRPGQLSGGQQQRVALARTIAVEPRVLLLDEPLSNLDAKLREHMRGELLALQRKLGLTTLFVTHDQAEALTIADRVAVLEHGVLQQVGTPVELYDAPANRFVASFVGAINLIEGRIERDAQGARFRAEGLADVALPATAGAPGAGPATLAFRPQAVAFNAPSSDGLALEGVVESREFLGNAVRYQLRVGAVKVLAEDLHLSGKRPLEAGARARLAVAASELRVFLR